MLSGISNALFGAMVSDMNTKPFQSPLFDSPANYDLPFEDVEFRASDGATLRGWLVKGATDRVIVQSHFGVQCNRAGYDPTGKGLITLSKAPIAFLRQAKHLQQEGYSVLMYDFRNHGTSDGGTIPWVTWGPEEAKDVIAAVDYISGREDFKDAKIGLLSICMGGSASTYAYGMDDGLKTRANVKAMVVVQPLLYNLFMKAFGMPTFMERAGTQRTMERTGIDLSTRSFLPDVKNITVPTMVIQNKNDPWTDLDFVQNYYDELTVEKQMVWIEVEKSRAAAYDFIGREPEGLTAWFDRHMA